jgi:Fe-S cluster assembly protein SufD
LTGEVVQTEGTLSQEAALEFIGRQKEPSWLGQWRRQALDHYQGTELPIRALHLWRYTDPALFLPAADPFAPGGPEVDLPPATAPMPASGELAGGASMVDGRLARVELGPECIKAGVRWVDLRAAAAESPELLQRVFGTIVGSAHGKFEALNAAVFRGGSFLYVPRGVVLEKPLHLVESLTRQGVTASRLAVLVEDGASVTLIDEISGDPAGDVQFYCVAEIAVGAEARVHHAMVQTASRKVTALMTHRSRLDRGATYFPVIASFGGNLTKLDTGAIMDGTGSVSEMTGILSATGRQKFDHHTVHHHRGEHTRSNLDFKTVLGGRSRSAYTGLIRIEPEARFSEAYQENRNLLLSEECRADSIPELEILTEEVQCKHGATVGPVDPEQVFYLTSRALPPDEAVRMIVEGHFESALKRLPEGLQERLRGILRERLKETRG